MQASINMGSFVMVAVIILVGVACISDITSQSGVSETNAPMHSSFETISTLLNGGLGFAAIAIFVLGGMIILSALNYI